MRIALAQINPVLGDFAGNAAKIVDFTRRASAKHADVVVFPEISLFGYPPNDALEREDLVSKQARFIPKILREIPPQITCIFGAIISNPKKTGKPYLNVAVVGQKKKKPQFFAKQLLPTYDIFDERRFFEAGEKTGVIQIPRVGRVAISVCEDMWCEIKEGSRTLYPDNPLDLKKIDLVINISASPFSKTKIPDRLKQARFHTSKLKCPFVYVNQVGGQDEIIFDGSSFILDRHGKCVVQASTGEEDLVISDLRKNLSEYRPPEEESGELLRKVLVLGLRDFLSKTGQKKVHLGLSGGIDSAVCAALAVDAVGPGNVTGLLLPGPYSSEGSVVDSEKLAKNLGIPFLKIDINELYKKTSPLIHNFEGQGPSAGLADQNIQARLRGLILMGYSNRTGSMLLSTANKSEMASGFATLYGDMCGGLMPLGDLVKGEVYKLAQVYNQSRELIPQEIINKAPSAELAPGQVDQDTLPPYDELDQAVIRLVEERKAPKTKTENWLQRALSRSEFKRWQSPPVLRVSRHSFGRGRRFPIAGRWA